MVPIGLAPSLTSPRATRDAAGIDELTSPLQAIRQTIQVSVAARTACDLAQGDLKLDDLDFSAHAVGALAKAQKRDAVDGVRVSKWNEVAQS